MHCPAGPVQSRAAEPIGRVKECIAEQQNVHKHMASNLKDYTGTLDLKGMLVRRATRIHFESILSQLKLEYVNILIRSDLIALLRRVSDIDTGHRLSFYRADLVLEAVDADGTTHYVTAEASYTADRRDTNRALRNAEYLQRCTGCPAHAVIASVNNDREVQRLVANGTIHWYRLTDKDLDTEWQDSSLRPDLPATQQLH